MFKHLSKDNYLSGLQWFFFIFCNTVVIPPTLQSVYQLDNVTAFCLTKYTFLVTGLACVAQVILGHKRAIMEGPTGLWWGTILTVTFAEASHGTPLSVIGGSFAVGIFIVGILTVVMAMTGAGSYLSKLFTPSVMVVFMLLLGAQLISIFLKGMLGLPFGISNHHVGINFPAFILALIVVVLVIFLIIALPSKISKYALLIGTIVGWIIYDLCFPTHFSYLSLKTLMVFPLGEPHWQSLKPGIIITAVLTGIVNISNTYGAIRGTDTFYNVEKAEPKVYRNSFMISGLFTILSAFLGLVPYSPFVSSIGLLTQTKDYSRQSFIIGSVIFLVIGAISALALFFAGIPLVVSSAVLLVSYLPLLFSSLSFSKLVNLNSKNIYRIAIPLFIGIFLMGLSQDYLSDVPLIIRPLLSNGLLMGIILSLILDNVIPWDRIK